MTEVSISARTNSVQAHKPLHRKHTINMPISGLRRVAKTMCLVTVRQHDQVDCLSGPGQNFLIETYLV